MFQYLLRLLFPKPDDGPEKIIVDTPLDVVDPNDGLTSLREAVMQAESDPTRPATIRFDEAVFNVGEDSGTVALETAIELSTEIHIDGLANGRRVTITGDVEGNDPTTSVQAATHEHGRAQDYDITDLGGFDYGVSTFLDDNTNLFVVADGEAHFENLVLTGGAGLGENDIGDGGAILLSGPAEVHIEKSLLGGNIAIQDGGAVSLFSPDGGARLEVRDSAFHGNISGNDGGAVYVSPGEVAHVATSQFVGNRSGIPGLHASTDDGGALANFGTASIAHSSFVGNQAGIIPEDEIDFTEIGVGGAIFNDGRLSVEHAKFLGNSASVSGAIQNSTSGELDIRHSLIADTESGFDAALTNFGVTTARGLVVTGNDRGLENAALDDGFGDPVPGTGIMSLRGSFVHGNGIDVITDANDPDTHVPSGTVSQPMDLIGFNLIGDNFTFDGGGFLF